MDHQDAAEERFRALHADTYTDLLRFVKRRIPDDDADDVVSTAYLVAWRRFDELPDDARPWLFGIARNLLANHTRSRRRRSVVDVRMVAYQRTTQADRSSGVDAHLDLVEAWWALSAADREVLALAAFDGLTDVQAAKVLGCARATFRMRLSRARHRLRARLEPALDLSTPIKSWSRA